MLECYTSNLLSQGCHEWIDEVLNVKPKLCSYLMLKVEGSTHTHTHWSMWSLGNGMGCFQKFRDRLIALFDELLHFKL